MDLLASPEGRWVRLGKWMAQAGGAAVRCCAWVRTSRIAGWAVAGSLALAALLLGLLRLQAERRPAPPAPAIRPDVSGGDPRWDPDVERQVRRADEQIDHQLAVDLAAADRHAQQRADAPPAPVPDRGLLDRLQRRYGKGSQG